MQTVSCPGCGAPVEFKSHAAVMAVCAYCRTVVVKDADAVKDLGKMSAVLEDYSRIQIGTAGTFAGRAFTVVGRIQLRYDAGMWNEWYLLFDDGADGWLGDSSGQYVMTLPRDLAPGWPAFEQIRPGQDYDLAGVRYTASERRVAQCVGGQGELPFVVGQGWQAKVADFRQEARFATLDYSDADTPALYGGSAVTLEQMGCQLLRDDEAIQASSGRYRGKVAALACPSCGASIAYVPGLAANIVCQNCHARLDAADPNVRVLAAGRQVERVEQQRFTLSLGTKAQVGGREYRLIGAMRRRDDENNGWNEYLLHSGADLFWLVETADGWSRAQVVHEWPVPGTIKSSQIRLDRTVFTRIVEYPATVEVAVGAFNWRVAAGDKVLVNEYAGGQLRLAAELTPDELTWSRSSPVAYDQVRTWFGLKAADVSAAAPAPGVWEAPEGIGAKWFVWAILLLNAIPLVLNFRGAAGWVLFGVLAVWLPPLFFGADGAQGSKGPTR